MIIKTLGVMLVMGLSVFAWGEEREVAPFSQISYGLPFDVEFVAGSEHKVILEGDQDTIDEIETQVSGKTLKISKDSGWFDWSDEEIRLTVIYTQLDGITMSGSGDGFANSIDADKFSARVNGSAGLEFETFSGNDLELTISGSGNINLNDLDADSVSVSISGSGDIEVAGNTIAQSIKITGSGDYNGRELQSKEATVAITGSGDAELSVEATLTASVTGSGDIVYYGNPQENTKVTGSGEIERRNP